MFTNYNKLCVKISEKLVIVIGKNKCLPWNSFKFYSVHVKI